MSTIQRNRIKPKRRKRRAREIQVIDGGFEPLQEAPPETALAAAIKPTHERPGRGLFTRGVPADLPSPPATLDSLNAPLCGKCGWPAVSPEAAGSADTDEEGDTAGRVPRAKANRHGVYASGTRVYNVPVPKSADAYAQIVTAFDPDRPRGEQWAAEFETGLNGCSVGCFGSGGLPGKKSAGYPDEPEALRCAAARMLDTWRRHKKSGSSMSDAMRSRFRKAIDAIIVFQQMRLDVWESAAPAATATDGGTAGSTAGPVQPPAVLATGLEPLKAAERKQLATLERTIGEGIKQFLAVGRALAEIKDQRLYRATHGTFDAYCDARWKMDRTHAYRLIGSAEVVDQLRPIGDLGDPVPESESQARPLVKLEPKERIKAWQEVLDRAPKDEAGKPQITARIVAAVVHDRLTPANSEVKQVKEPQRREERTERKKPSLLETVRLQLIELESVRNALFDARRSLAREPKRRFGEIAGRLHNLAVALRDAMDREWQRIGEEGR